MECFAVVEWFGRPEIETDEVRERRITMEAVVDAYNEQERAVGWYYYLEGKLNFPFLSHCATRRSTSPHPSPSRRTYRARNPPREPCRSPRPRLPPLVERWISWRHTGRGRGNRASVRGSSTSL